MTEVFFEKALPVWLANHEKEMNTTCRFTGCIQRGNATLKITGSSFYRLFINGKYILFGPARGPKGYFRVDEVDITPYLTEQNNTVVFEVNCYNVNTYYINNQPAFLQAEVVLDNDIALYTGVDGNVSCEEVTNRIKKVQRLSFQRGFAESWILDSVYNESYTQPIKGGKELVEFDRRNLLSRNVPFPILVDLYPEKIVSAGAVSISSNLPDNFTDKAKIQICDVILGYRDSELDVKLSDDAAHYRYSEESGSSAETKNILIKKDKYAIFKFARDYSGFIKIKLSCKNKAQLILTFDEILKNGDIDYSRIDCCNIIRCDVEVGEYEFISFEPYTMQFLKIIAFNSDVKIEAVSLIEFSAPDSEKYRYSGSDPIIKSIWEAGVETFRQNAVDMYTDCPSRERAGWLCDSYWIGRVEYLLTGKSIIEKNFLENFLLPNSFDYLPDGMLPMCYPADHIDGNYIPTWPMWLVLELGEYYNRSNDRDLINAFKTKIYKFFNFLDRYLNNDGLLEKLDKWVFVEWSKANDFVQDVNFPANMLYSACKRVAGNLYNDNKLIEDADKMASVIRRLSFDGNFFTDHLVYDDYGKLYNPGDTTETCQYYAFYFKIATRELYPDLWNVLVNEFGPKRKKQNKYPRVYFSNAFIGNYLRLDMLYRENEKEAVIDNIKGYFYDMAKLTGTLWEHDSTFASLCHGFASHVLVWLKE